MSRLEAAANVVLRVPALALLDVLYRWDAAAVAELLRPRPGEGLRGDALLRPRALWGASCVGEGVRGERGLEGVGAARGRGLAGAPQGLAVLGLWWGCFEACSGWEQPKA